MRAAMLTSSTAMQVAAERADVHVRMPVQNYGMFEWGRLEELIETGYESGLRELTPVRDSLLR
jgi:NTE family protein